MSTRWWFSTLTVALALTANAQTSAQTSAQTKVLRVCADPDNLPFSNDKGEGFDNKIAALIATDLGDSVAYTWWPTRRGFIRNTLSDRRCDVIMGVPKDYDPIVPTTPYYRAHYVLLTRHDGGVKITSLDDPALAKLKIGVGMMGDDYANTPPGMALNQRGLGAHLVGFHTYYNKDTRPDDIVKAVADGSVDAAVVWGPIAGYYAKQSPVKLDMVTLPDSDKVSGFPFAYDVVMGVRHGDRSHLAQLNGAIARRKSDIDQILREYGISTEPQTGTTN
jgi:quinoprotein dehydrogenase-associated probable ABC transporter substrate-binding protein